MAVLWSVSQCPLLHIMHGVYVMYVNKGSSYLGAIIMQICFPLHMYFLLSSMLAKSIDRIIWAILSLYHQWWWQQFFCLSIAC